MTQIDTNSLPCELKELKQWTFWKKLSQTKKDGSIETTKPPCNKDGYNSDCTQSKNLLPFETALNTFYQEKGKNKIDGIGFAFNESGISGIDIDHCIDEAGNLTKEAREIIDQVNSYTELSPSGTGIHILVKGTIPEKYRKEPSTEQKKRGETKGYLGGKKGCFEAYSSGRYFTVTGKVFENRRKIEERQQELTWFWETFVKAEPKEKQLSQEKEKDPVKQSAPSCDISTKSDEEILKIAKNDQIFQALWNGDTSKYGGDNSAADMALMVKLAFYCCKDSEKMERLFSQSGLGQRDKWKEREDYRRKTITGAIERQPKVFEAKSKTTNGVFDKTKETLGFAEIIAQGKAAQKSWDEILIPARDTDKGNAERFQAVFENKAIHTPEMGWMIWFNNHWKADERGVRDMFKYAVSEEIHKEIDKLNQKRDKESLNLIEKLSKWLKQSQGAKLITSGLQWANSDACFRGYIDDFDKDLYAFNVLNGTINLRTGEIQSHDPKDKITKISKITYDKNADCLVWKTFLNRIFEGKKDLIRFIQKSIGYTLTGEIIEQIWYFLFGTGQNGKSTFVDVISKLHGDYCQKADMKTFSESQIDNSTSTPELAEFPGKRFVFATETKQGKAFDCGRIKDWTGGEKIPARQIYKIPFNFFPHFKLWLAGNHKPIIKDSTLSTWRRIRFIPFNVTISDNEKDERLPQKLEAELSGILNWAIEGCLAWQSEGLKPPKEVVDATNEYQESQDRLSPFIKGACITERRLSVPFKVLYETYVSFCETNKDTAMSKPAFKEAIQERGYRTKEGHARTLLVDGITTMPNKNAETII